MGEDLLGDILIHVAITDLPQSRTMDGPQIGLGTAERHPSPSTTGGIRMQRSRFQSRPQARNHTPSHSTHGARI